MKPVTFCCACLCRCKACTSCFKTPRTMCLCKMPCSCPRSIDNMMSRNSDRRRPVDEACATTRVMTDCAATRPLDNMRVKKNCSRCERHCDTSSLADEIVPPRNASTQKKKKKKKHATHIKQTWDTLETHHKYIINKKVTYVSQPGDGPKPWTTNRRRQCYYYWHC